jgi:hypothetical protein
LRDAIGEIPGHELAVLADPAWTTRGRLVRGLRERCRRARAAGVSISSLAGPSPLWGTCGDALVSQRISCIRSERRGRLPAGGTEQLRFGLTDIPGYRLPAPSRWWGDRSRGLRRAMRHRLVCHLIIDCPRLAARGGHAARIGALVRRMAHCAAAGALLPVTMSEAARRLSPPQRGSALRSILHAA